VPNPAEFRGTIDTFHIPLVSPRTVQVAFVAVLLQVSVFEIFPRTAVTA
jgi:hypothetical protein